MENETKSRIITESLKLFSEKGYGATSVHEIAKAVGIKAPSLYNHFDSKQKIFDAIVDMMTERFGKVSIEASLPNGEASTQGKQYADGGIDFLKATAHYIFHYYLTEGYASQFRKMLSIEKYSNPEADLIHSKIYIDGPIAYQAEIFAEMIRQGYMIDADPKIMAIHFFSPMFLLLDKYGTTPENEPEAIEILDKHIEQFCMIYDKKQSYNV